MKNVGIIGGFGPETTAKFQLRLTELFMESGVAIRPGILTWNTPVPVKLEHDLILSGKGIDKFLPLLVSAAKKLEDSGSSFLVLPCNTLHIHLDKIRQSVTVPTLNIIDESILFLEKHSIKKIAILGTSVTVGSQMHAKKMIEAGIVPVFPSKQQQAELNQIIHNLICGMNKRTAGHELRPILTNLAKRSDNNFLLACTDLQLIDFNLSKFNVVDSLEVLALATVRNLINGKDKSL